MSSATSKAGAAAVPRATGEVNAGRVLVAMGVAAVGML